MEKKKTPRNKRCVAVFSAAAAAAAAVDDDGHHQHCKEDARMRVTMAFCVCVTCGHCMWRTREYFGIKGSRFRHNQHSFILKLVLNYSIERNISQFPFVR